MADCLSKELFLDILTKEEKEALLTKKMEEIRKKNAALRKRHEEIEADKRYADKLSPKKEGTATNNSQPTASSPRKESKHLPGEERKGPRPPKSGGRGKPSGSGRGKEKTQENVDIMRWEPRRREHVENFENADEDQRQPPPPQHNSAYSSGRRRTRMSSSSDENVKGNSREPRRREHAENFENADGDRRQLPPPQHNSSHPSGRRRTPMLSPEDGPPPDPAYNFLADKRREGPAVSEREWDQAGAHSRRHPKNFGGQDFKNVKSQMQNTRERHDRTKQGPPRTKMEMAMVMTGRERKQYAEWKTERDRIDLERLERQKSSSGEWRRAWDAEKIQQDFEEPTSPRRTEPAKRPAGRIGSGRFDRGERDERHRGENPWQKAGVRQEPDAQIKPIGRGRARGRGRGRGRGTDRSPCPRTFSGGDETRRVECQKDLLVVKIDNSPGKEANQSVEVEYWDDDLVDVKSPSPAPPAASSPKPSSHEAWEDDRLPVANSNHYSASAAENHHFDVEDDAVMKSKGDCDHLEVRDRSSYSQSLGDENEHDESWEDCPEDAEFYGAADDDMTGYLSGECPQEIYESGSYKEPLKLDCQLNPDAPVFMPTSPEFMKTPPGHVKVMDWVAEVTSNLSPVSPPEVEGFSKKNSDPSECKKALFSDDATAFKVDSMDSVKQSSSHGGVEESGLDKKVSANEQSQPSVEMPAKVNIEAEEFVEAPESSSTSIPENSQKDAGGFVDSPLDEDKADSADTEPQSGGGEEHHIQSDDGQTPDADVCESVVTTELEPEVSLPGDTGRENAKTSCGGTSQSSAANIAAPENTETDICEDNEFTPTDCETEVSVPSDTGKDTQCEANMASSDTSSKMEDVKDLPMTDADVASPGPSLFEEMKAADASDKKEKSSDCCDNAETSNVESETEDTTSAEGSLPQEKTMES